MKVLVTGACGLLGSEICHQLSDKDIIVHAVDNLSRGFDRPSCDCFYNLDLSDPISFNELDDDYDVIYHYAAINGTSNFYERPNDVLRINTLIDLNVFNFANSFDNKPLVVYASSSEIVAGDKNDALDESVDVTIEDITNARWSYRLVKIMSENYLANSNLNYIIFRYFNVYGSRSKPGHFVADQLEKIQKGTFSLIGSNETRSFCHVSDAVDATMYCSSKSLNEIINIGNDCEIKIIDAANIIAQVLGVDAKDIHWEHINGRSGSTQRRLPDINKLRKMYPEYKPMCFKDGMKKSI